MFLHHSILFFLLFSVTLSSGLQETPNKSMFQNRTASADGLVSNTPYCKQYDQNSPTQKCETDDECPFWTMCNSTTRECECRQDYHYLFDGIVECNDGKLSVLDSYCVTYTYDNSTGQDSLVAGSCVLNSIGHRLKENMYSKLHLTLPVNLTEINTEMCGKYFNRSGRLCGECREGYRPLAYTYRMPCVNCTEHEGTSNLFIYFTLVFLPITVFYFIVLFFKINVTSSYLHGFILFCQTISLSTICRSIALTLEDRMNIGDYSMPIKIFISLHGIWALDFFQMASPGICLDMSPLSVRALDYTIALYPFFLTTLSYVFIELHDWNLRLLVIIWKPFRCLFTMFRRQWNIRTSVIDAYATFYLLSLSKILSITFDMLTPIAAFDLKVPNGTKYTYVLYYDGNIEYFGAEHLPYAIPAIIIAVLFVVLPTTLLLFYPCRCFQYLLNRTKCRWHILHMLMDSFQGCYKDGTEPGTRDCRYFAGLYILLRIVFYIVYSFTLTIVAFPLTIFVIICFVVIITNVQPHKEAVSHYNKINVTFLCFLVLDLVLIIAVDLSSLRAPYLDNGFYIFTTLVCLIPLIYILCIFIYWAITNRGCGREFVNRVRDWWRGYNSIDDDDFLPHRLTNPSDYQIMDNSVSLEPVTEHENGISTINEQF